MNRLRKFAFPLLIPLLLVAACGGQGASQPEEASRLEVLERAAVVASRGGATTLDVANWNVEWFGDTGHGPTDESLQLANVRDTILGGDFDVWGLEEVVSNSAFNSLESQLPGYAGFISNESSVMDGSAYYSSTEQKLGILYKTSVASLVSARVILTQNDYAFAGRPPLEVKLDVTLNGVTEERVFIVVHMKAYDDGESWQRRQNASAALKSYLDATYPTQKVFIIGDFNDDLDTSITAGHQSPYENFVADSSRYDFPSWTFSQNQMGTTCSYPDAVDHQLNTNEQYADLVTGSVEVYRVDQQLSSYCTTTSDHYPVLARYSFGTGAPAGSKVILNEILANEPGNSTAGEFVEIANVGGTAFDVSGWKLGDGAAARHTFAAGTVLDAGEALVVFASASAIPVGTPNAIGSSTGALSLANGGDSVSLRNASGAVVDSLTYSSSLASKDGVSMNRNPDATAGAGFVLHEAMSSLKSSPGTRASGVAF